jgi:glucose-6-phosphate 1-dehydrogenase
LQRKPRHIGVNITSTVGLHAEFRYERVLGDAMAGDAALFAREDYVEEAWRIVDPALKASTPISQYEQKTWGPAEVEKQVSPPGGWLDPLP